MPNPTIEPTESRVKTIPHRLSPCRAGIITVMIALAAAGAANLSAQSPYASTADFAEHARMLREHELLKVEPQVFVPSTTSPVAPTRSLFGSRSPWKENITTTVFNIGEQPTKNNPTPNHSSSWDPNWEGNYGGFDDPDSSHRRGYFPATFIPRQNPFYCALPYNDVTRGTTKAEARVVIPWFNQAFQQEGHSVCKDHWVAIRHLNRVVYAQWSDCGPFRTDHYQYVFGNEVPRPNLNGGAGLDVSPAVRDALAMNSTRDICSWKFVDASEVPAGPWRQYGDNNIFANRALSNPNSSRVQAGGSGSLFGR